MSLSKPSDFPRYKMDHTNRGMAFIIINSETKGKKKAMKKVAKIDASRLQEMFKTLGFMVVVHENKTANEMTKLMHEVAGMDHSNSDCFACVLLTCGEEVGAIGGTDKPIFLEDLLQPLRGEKCPTLAGKPKLFFIEGNRGKEDDVGVQVQGDVEFDASPYDEPATHTIPSDADFLVAFSTVEGHVSYAHSEYGSWFIQALAEVFKEYGQSEDLLRLLTRVNLRVANQYETTKKSLKPGRKQMPCVMTMLTKELYFGPK